jgi:hypothetical protein
MPDKKVEKTGGRGITMTVQKSIKLHRMGFNFNKVDLSLSPVLPSFPTPTL